MRVRRRHDPVRDCAFWQEAEPTDSPRGTGGVHDRYRAKVETRSGESVNQAFSRSAQRLLRYDIFPPHIMRAEICSDGGIAQDVVIVQIVPLGLALVLEAAVRVTDVWREVSANGEEIGFRYVTLSGHPERGVSSFAVRREPDGVYFEIDARSRPGTLLTLLTRPFARRFQKRATEAALVHFTAANDASS